MVLSFALGLGVLSPQSLCSVERRHASSGVHILFGSLMSLSGSLLLTLLLVACVVFLVLATISRPLLFASIDPDSARAKGVPIKALDYAFLVLLAATTVVSIQAIGVLLAFALISAPAGAAHKLTRNPGLSFVAALLLGLGITWSGIVLAFFGPWSRIPAGVYIATFSALTYGLALLRDRFRVRSRPEANRHNEREIHSENQGKPVVEEVLQSVFASSGRGIRPSPGNGRRAHSAGYIPRGLHRPGTTATAAQVGRDHRQGYDFPGHSAAHGQRSSRLHRLRGWDSALSSMR